MFTRAVVLKTPKDLYNAKFELRENFQYPELGDSDVLIKIKACGLSRTNLKILEELKLTACEELPVGREISGIITEVGSEVTRVSVGDEVSGVIALDSPCGGCALFCILSQYDVVKKPEKVSHVDAAGSIIDGIKSYTALHYQARLCAGETVLIIDGSSAAGIISIQLAQTWGAKVLTTCSSDEEKHFLENLQPPVDLVIDLRKSKKSFVSVCLEETGGMGVDCIVDNGVSMYSKEFENEKTESDIYGSRAERLLPSKHDIISSLAVSGRWITSQLNLQLDPPESKILFLKGASVSFLFEHVWTFSGAQQGRLLHIMKDLLDKIANGTIRPMIHHTVVLEDVCETLLNIEKNKVGKIVMTV